MRRILAETVDEVLAVTDRLPVDEDPRIGQLRRHWTDLLSRHGRVPYRRELDPLAFPRALSIIWIYERTASGYMCRLAGEEVRLRFPGRIVGVALHELIRTPSIAMIEAHYDAVLDRPAVGHSCNPAFLQALDRVERGARMLFPLLGDDGAARFVVGATAYGAAGDRDPANRRVVRSVIPLEDILRTSGEGPAAGVVASGA